MAQSTATVHASAVLVGARAVLIRGPSGAGKSRLALALIEAARTGTLRFARLVGDDRVYLEPVNGRLLVRPAEALAGLIEVRGVGLRRLEHEPSAVVGLLVDLAAADAERLPETERQHAVIAGLSLPRLAIAEVEEALPAVLAVITSGGFEGAVLALKPASRAFQPARHRIWLDIGNHNAATLGRCFARRRLMVDSWPIRLLLPQCNNRQNSARMPLALGLWMVKMSTLSCGATGTRPRGVS